jgi:hypothetical protein
LHRDHRHANQTSQSEMICDWLVGKARGHFGAKKRD